MSTMCTNWAYHQIFTSLLYIQFMSNSWRTIFGVILVNPTILFMSWLHLAHVHCRMKNFLRSVGHNCMWFLILDLGDFTFPIGCKLDVKAILRDFLAIYSLDFGDLILISLRPLFESELKLERRENIGIFMLLIDCDSDAIFIFFAKL